MKITKQKLIALNNLFFELATTKMNVHFHYLIAKNRRIIETEILSLEEAQKPSEEYVEYEKSRLALCQKYSAKDDTGKPVINYSNPQTAQNGGEFVFSPETEKEFLQEVTKLREDNEETVKEFEKKKEDFLEILKEEVDIDFSKIPFSKMPEELNGAQMEILFDLIEEDK